MVALDQRESLCAMLRARARPDDPAAVTTFKLAAVRALAPYASGLLIDREYGFDRVVADRMLPEGCGPILAADRLDQPLGEPVRDTDLDPGVDPAGARRAGAVALKLLVLWKRDGEDERRVATAGRFVESCREAGLLSVLEGVAGDDSGILEAAHALGALRPDVYKAQVPGHGTSPAGDLVRACEAVDAAVPVPWVVLSNGVAPPDFPRAVEAACRAGASGFLAGRAVWSEALDAPDLDTGLRESADRLRRLVDIVEAHARPWQGKR